MHDNTFPMLIISQHFAKSKQATLAFSSISYKPMNFHTLTSKFRPQFYTNCMPAIHNNAEPIQRVHLQIKMMPYH